MITKKEWAKYRKSQNLPLSVIYDFYVEHRKPNRRLMTEEQFSQFFPMFMAKYENLNITVSVEGVEKTVVVTFSQVAYIVGRFYEKKYYKEKINP